MTDGEVERGGARHQRTLFFLWLTAAGLIFLSWLQVFSLVNASLTRELDAAESDLANLTRVSQEHARHTLRSADQVLRFVQSRYLEIGPALDLSALTAKGVIDAEIFNQVGVIDTQGIYKLSNLPIAGKLDLSDRDHFKVHVAADTGELFISKPLLGRASGKWSIQLSRRISRADGQFAGVAVLSIDPGYFTHFYGELNLGPKGLHALYGLDGIARARKVGSEDATSADSAFASPQAPPKPGSIALTSPMLEQIGAGKLAGAFTQRSGVDGGDRTHFRGLDTSQPAPTLTFAKSSRLKNRKSG